MLLHLMLRPPRCIIKLMRLLRRLTLLLLVQGSDGRGGRRWRQWVGKGRWRRCLCRRPLLLLLLIYYGYLHGHGSWFIRFCPIAIECPIQPTIPYLARCEIASFALGVNHLLTRGKYMAGDMEKTHMAGDIMMTWQRYGGRHHDEVVVAKIWREKR